MKIYFSHKEELWNSWSHAAGIILGMLVGTALLVWCGWARNGWATAGVILYLFGMLSSYIASTVYHALSAWSPWKERLRKWDHAAIYWHIAGSYSPITLVALREYGYWGWTLFAFIWTAAIVGTVKSFSSLKGHSNLETICYVAMGLSVLVAFKPLMHCVDPSAIIWIIAEGRVLHHWCRVLRCAQAPLYAHRVPLLRARRQRVPHRSRVGYTHALVVAQLLSFVPSLSS